MLEEVTKSSFNAVIKQVTVKDTVTIQLVLDPEYIAEMPTIAKMANRIVMVGIEDAQQEIPLYE